LRLNPIRTCDVIRLFNSLIDVIVEPFHNFLLQPRYFCGLESITCRKCKNMLLILGNVAKMLPVVRERLLLDVNSRTAHLVSKQFSITFTIDYA